MALDFPTSAVGGGRRTSLSAESSHDDGLIRGVDLTSPGVAEYLEEADAVVHVCAADDLGHALGLDPVQRRTLAVGAAQAVSTAAAAAGVRRLVAITSAMILDEESGAGQPFSDDAAPLMRPDPGLVGDLVEVDALAARAAAAHPGLDVVRLRPAALVGPGVDTFLTRHFAAPRLLTVREHRMRWQFCHVDDLAAAVLTVLRQPAGSVAPTLGVGAPGSLDQAAVETISGMRSIELPFALARSTAEQLHRLGVLPLPAGDLSYVVHPWLVSAEGLAGLGWRAGYDNETCLGVVLHEAGQRRTTGRRLTRKDAAALGAAGAAVAAVATAAIWRSGKGGSGKTGADKTGAGKAGRDKADGAKAGAGKAGAGKAGIARAATGRSGRAQVRKPEPAQPDAGRRVPAKPKSDSGGRK